MYLLPSMICLAFSLVAQGGVQHPHPIQIKSDKAVELVMALPEIKQWAAFIEKQSQAKKHGGCVLVSPKDEPESRNGRFYWRINFMEFDIEPGMPSHRWETFLVRLKDGAIFVEDFQDLKVRNLLKWRKEKQPHKRIQ